MKTFLISLAMSIALSASLIVIIDRFQGATQQQADALHALNQRMIALERGLVAPARKSDGENPGGKAEPPQISSIAGALPPKTFADAIRLLEEIEGMVLDCERGIRADLKRIFESLLLRIDEASLRATPPQDAAEGRRMLREKIKAMGVGYAENDTLIELQGEIGEPNRALEFLMVAPGGRAYESLLLVDVVPSALKIAMEDLGFVESDPNPEDFSWGPNASAACVYVSWEGEAKPRRIEDLVYDRTRDDVMESTKWVFTASRFLIDDRKWERYFSADLQKGVASLTYNYATDCLLACPLAAAANENNWFPHPKNSPKPGTKLRILISKDPRPEWDRSG